MDSNAIFMHIDLDMFFCAVEMRDNPSLENVPFVVGSKCPSLILRFKVRRSLNQAESFSYVCGEQFVDAYFCFASSFLA